MRILWRIVSDFFVWIWRLLNFIRNLVINLFFIFVVLVCIYYWVDISNGIQAHHSERVALLLDITGVIVDKPSTKTRLGVISRQLFNTTTSHLKENSLFDIIDVIRRAKNDSNITGIVLDLKNFVGTDQPSMQYIGKVLREFSDSGKPVIAIGENYNQEQYYLASFANKIWLSPHGVVDLHGFALNELYYKSFLNKLKVTTHIFRVGNYKSAVEPFIRDDMSQTVREENSRWINELWKNYLTTIADNRHVTIQQIFPGAQKMLSNLCKMDGNTAQYALHTNLVDELGSSAEIEKSLSSQFGWNAKNKSYRAISMYDYMGGKNSKEGDDAIAVIFVSGIIIDNEEIPGNINSSNIVAQIRNARLNPKIKAIVLRVNSPGGSVNASEAICEELSAVRSIGKPVIVSMGGIAASGGYWISAPADYIIANPNTITGSIGIFGIINTIENSLNYLGVHTDGIATSPLADVTVTKTLPPEVSKMIELRIKDGYKRFITSVAQSRRKTLEQIDLIAQGHIWTGKDAKDNGLIDGLGDFDDSIIKAVELAKLKQWYIEYYRDSSNFFETIIHKISESALMLVSQRIQTYLPVSVAMLIESIQKERSNPIIFNDLQNCYALCITCTNVN